MRYLICVCPLLFAQAAAAQDMLLDRIAIVVAAAPECGFAVNRARVLEATTLAATNLASRQAFSAQPAPALAPAPPPPPPPPAPSPAAPSPPIVPASPCHRFLAEFGPNGRVFAGIVARASGPLPGRMRPGPVGRGALPPIPIPPPPGR